MNWTLTVILVCMLLAIFTIWLEYKRADKNRLTWRVMALVIAVTALVCIALPVKYPFGAHLFSDSAVLLTENYYRDSLKEGNYKNVFTLDKGIKKAYPNAVLLSSIQDIHTIDPTINQLHILGYGLDDASLQQLGGIKLSYTPPPAPDGVLTVNWQQQLKIGEPLKVQGRYNNTSSKPVKLILKGLNTTLDSTGIITGVSTFQLNAVPKITGRAAYSLLAISGKDTIANESVPIAIEPAKPLKVLMLSAAPDFENKFLKDWLSQNGYGVAVRATISKDKTSRDFANMEPLPLDNLSSVLLAKFDVVISDLSTLTALNPTENIALKQQVEQNGLGVIIRVDTTIRSTPWLASDFKAYAQNLKTDAVAIHIAGEKNPTAPLNIGTTYLAGGNDKQTLAVDAQKNNLVEVGLKGQGKLIWATVRSTYTWMLSGNVKDYSAYWSLLLNKAARKLPADAVSVTSNGIATINEPAYIQLNNSPAAPAITVDGAKLAPAQNPSMAFTYNTTYWPGKLGWVQVNVGSNQSSWAYIYRENDWKSIKNLKKIGDTKKYSDNRDIITAASNLTADTVRPGVPKVFFYILLLAACSFLWAERKLIA